MIIALGCFVLTALAVLAHLVFHSDWLLAEVDDRNAYAHQKPDLGLRGPVPWRSLDGRWRLA